jgi:hypothetical protein
MSSLMVDGGSPPHDPAMYDGDQNLPPVAAVLIVAARF